MYIYIYTILMVNLHVCRSSQCFVVTRFSPENAEVSLAEGLAKASLERGCWM